MDVRADEGVSLWPAQSVAARRVWFTRWRRLIVPESQVRLAQGMLRTAVKLDRTS